MTRLQVVAAGLLSVILFPLFALGIARTGDGPSSSADALSTPTVVVPDLAPVEMEAM